ncbi:MAG: response regulator [Elusimicrobiota bacterium]|nr:response regulator [Elusimicrobiota bacterium]
MKILIVEDDVNKRVQIYDFISSEMPGSGISTARSYNSALTGILATRPELIILDMSMPTYDVSLEEHGGRPQHFAGREIMRQIDRREFSIRVIVVTQFDVFGEGSEAMTRSQLDDQLKSEHDRYLGMVYYNAATDGWKTDLARMLTPLKKEPK